MILPSTNAVAAIIRSFSRIQNIRGHLIRNSYRKFAFNLCLYEMPQMIKACVDIRLKHALCNVKYNQKDISRGRFETVTFEFHLDKSI